MSLQTTITPDWKWASVDCGREFDRMLDRRLTMREKLRWLEEAETLTITMRRHRPAAVPPPSQASCRIDRE
jgi:hypothetical protein